MVDYTIEINIDGYTIGIDGDGSVDLNVPERRHGGICDIGFDELEQLFKEAKRHKTAYDCYVESGHVDAVYTDTYESLK